MLASLNAFDEALWSADQAVLDDLRIEDLAKVAHQSGMQMPQMAVATALSTGDRPLQHLVERGVGIVDAREAAWGGLIRAVNKGAPYVVLLWLNDDGVAFFLGATAYTDTRWRRVEQSWLRNAAPQLVGASLAGGAFLETARALSTVGPVHVSRLAAVVDDDASSYNRGWREGGQTLAGAMEEINDGMTVHKLQLVIGDGQLALHLRRNGGASYYSGEWTLFAEHVIGRLAHAARNRRDLLDRPRRKPDAVARETLVLSLGGHRLAESATRTELLDSMRSLRGVRIAVFHRNPYLHLLVSDHLDGSTFDLFVTDDHDLQLIPGPYASVSALGRVTDALSVDLGTRDLLAVAVPRLISEAEFLAES